MEYNLSEIQQKLKKKLFTKSSIASLISEEAVLKEGRVFVLNNNKSLFKDINIYIRSNLKEIELKLGIVCVDLKLPF